MIFKVVQIHWQRLRHNRVEWLLTFVVPIAFFSIFALIFSRGVGSTPRIKVVLVDLSAESDAVGKARIAKVLDRLRESEGLRIVDSLDSDSMVAGPSRVKRSQEAIRQEAESLVRRGAATLAVILSSKGDAIDAQLLNDASDQVASQVVSALVTRALLQSQFDHNDSQAASFQSFVTNLAAKPAVAPELAGEAVESSGEASGLALAPLANEKSPFPVAFTPPKIDIVNVMGQNKSNPVVSVYAAGIAVMFLLFGATSGGGVLLEERENHTLERLLSTQMTMDQLLLGKWFYLTLLGIVQVTVMFGWAQLVFGLDLLGHLDGFLMMTVVTSAAAASFGLFLATLCQTRGQLNGLSVVLVLTMSALGGSMVPRYVMSEKLREFGLWTFNAWALDGYDKVFWRELPCSELTPQLSVLLGTAFALLLMARLLALRWEFS